MIWKVYPHFQAKLFPILSTSSPNRGVPAPHCRSALQPACNYAYHLGTGQPWLPTGYPHDENRCVLPTPVLCQLVADVKPAYAPLTAMNFQSPYEISILVGHILMLWKFGAL